MQTSQRPQNTTEPSMNTNRWKTALNAPVDGDKIARDIGLGRDDAFKFPSTPPALIGPPHGLVIQEPRRANRPKSVTTKFIIAYMLLYPGIIHKNQTDKYTATGGDLRLNKMVQSIITPAYVKHDGVLSLAGDREWSRMITDIEGAYPELLWFSGSWAARWLIARTWSARNRNAATAERRTLISNNINQS